MIGNFFKTFLGGPAPARRRPGRELSRDLVALLVSGPCGGTDQVLWTLLLGDRPAVGARCSRPRVVGPAGGQRKAGEAAVEVTAAPGQELLGHLDAD